MSHTCAYCGRELSDPCFVASHADGEPLDGQAVCSIACVEAFGRGGDEGPVDAWLLSHPDPGGAALAGDGVH